MFGWADFLNAFRSRDNPSLHGSCPEELHRLSLMIDRVDEMPEICRFIKELKDGKEQAGIIILCGALEHALTDLSERFVWLQHDPVTPGNELRDLEIRCASPDFACFPIMDDFERNLSPWAHLLKHDTTNYTLKELLRLSSVENTLWIVPFAISQNRNRKIEKVEKHLSFVSDAVREIRGRAKFLFVYCINCEDELAELNSKAVLEAKTHMAKLAMHSWRRVAADDLHSWFNFLRDHRDKPALRHIDLNHDKINVVQKLCGENAERAASMRHAIDELRKQLSPRPRPRSVSRP